MKKYIHYCWFGDKPLSKLAKKCIKSWKKYLPDYEIIKWSEENVDLNECPFIKEAYAKKKWAFVADYARTKAMYEMGGIYFDTDMMLKKDISFLLDKPTFLGVEDSLMVNAAVWGANKPKSWLSKEMLKFYQSQEHFNEADIYSISIPRIITRILNKKGFNPTDNDIQILNKEVYVYPREYFYPLSYNYRNNVFTDKTCMVHYFEATWIPKYEQRENKIFRMFGEKNGQRLINFIRFSKRIIKKLAKLCLFPVVLYRRHKRRYNKEYLKNIDNAVNIINKIKSDYIVFHNPEWFGVTSATKELFENTVPMGEIRRKKERKKVISAIINNKSIKQIIYSAKCFGWKELAIDLKKIKPGIKIKVFWHGNNSQVSEPYGWQRNMEIIELHKQNIIDVFATCKESIIPFYIYEGYRTKFITNRVDIKGIKKQHKQTEKLSIGLYAAKSNDWRKNMFTQISAVALLDNAVLDMVPLNPEAKNFATITNVSLNGLDKAIPREELLRRMSMNDINLYVTFSECSPMLPLESFAMGVPCITGNNHHYFKGTELEKYLVVNNEMDAEEIKNKILYCLENKELVMKLYNKWVKENNEQSKKDVQEFLEM